MSKGWRAALGVLLLVSATGVAVSARAQAASPVAASPRPVTFAKMAARIPAGTPWAHLQYGAGIFPCRDDYKLLTWDAKNNEEVQDPEFERVFREQLAQAGFKVSGDPNNLFEEDQKSTDLQVGALVTGVNALFCGTQTLGDRMRKADRIIIKGWAVMNVEWQVYSTSQARVVARIPTEARYETTTPIDAGNVVILQRAFAANVQALTASEAFRTALAGSPVAAPASSPAMAALSLGVRPASVPMPLDQAAKGVVSIFAGAGMGSGVLISPDGYILTNHHVAGEAGRVRVRWPDGSDTVGEVIRADRRRDVALIKTTPKAQPLAIRHAPVRLGETVFAIGTPLDRDLAGTLTRGVVSTPSRVIEGQSFIQSDVGVTHGNSGGPLLDEKGAIIGLTVMGLYPEESKSLNLFIPIDDALRALAVTPQG